MGKEFLKKTTDLLQAKQKKKQWQKIVISLSLVVAMITSGLLIHPAITMERKAICGQEEHTHSAECYEKKLICDKEEHTASEVEGAAAKGETIEEHKHSDSCYKEELTCDKKEHKHSEDCYPKETEAKEETSQAKSTEETKTTEAPKAEETTEASKEEKKADEAKEETTEEKQEEKAEARTLTAKGEDYTVQVDCPAEAKIPENAELKVREIVKDKESDKEEYEAYYKKAQDALKEKEGQETDISTVRFFDISFMVDGKEIEPAAKVEVKITYYKKVEVSDKGEVKSVHFGDDKTEVLDVKTNEENGKMDEVTFDATSFSVYGIVGTETISTQVITAEGETYTIEVTYGPEAKIPTGAILTATEITQDSEEWQNYYVQTAAAMGEEAGPAYARFFDIKIMADGEEVEPEAPVETKITYTEGINLMEGMDVKAVHFTKEEKVELLDVEYAVNEENNTGEFAFTQDSFSVTGVVTNTITSGSQYIIYMQSDSGNRYAMAHKLNTQAISASGNSVGSTVTSLDGTENNVLWTFESTSGGYYIYYREGDNTYYLRDSRTQDKNTGTLTVTTNRKESGTVWTYSNKRIRNTQNRQRYLQRDEDSYRARRDEYSTIYLALYTPPTPVNLTVHYINESGEEIHTPTTVPARTDSGVTAITDVVIPITGNTYHNTYIGSDRSMQIVPELRSDGNGAWSYQVYGQEAYTGFSEDSHIYVVYGDPYAASGSGGSGGSGGDTPNIGTPQTSKDLIPNGDGTYTLSLSITGKGASGSSGKGANVILILDTSNSMNTQDATNSAGKTVSRFTAAVEAAQSVSSNLLGLNTTDNPNLVEMCLVEFNWDVSTSGWYTDAGQANAQGRYPEGSFNRKIADASRNSGTNWEGALQAAIAAAQGHNDGDATYIVFLTDGNPSAYTGTNGGNGRHTSEADITTSSSHYYRISDNYMHATDEARSIVQNGYYFYSIGMYGNVDVLKYLTNFAYDGRSDTKDSGHYFSAKETNALISSLDDIAEVIKNSLSLAGVDFEDGIATDTTHTALSTTVSGTPGGVTYSKTGGTTTGYTVRVNNAGVPTFTVGSTSQQGTTATITYDRITGETTTEQTEATVYQATIGGTTYNMPMATITNGQLDWDLSPLGTLEDQATYKISFVVWPDQDVYDYVANLNNGLATWNSSTQTPVTDSSGNVLYYKNGVSGYPNIVYYPSADKYAALTNTNQSVTYYVANTEEAGGTTTTTYTEGDPIALPTPDPMGLTSSLSEIQKKWNVELQKTQLISYLFDTYTGESKEKSIDFTVKQDGVNYKTVTLGWDSERGEYTWADTTETINYYGRDYEIGSLWAEDFAIANGIMLSAARMTALGLDTSKYPSGTYGGTTYYIIESGHDYDIEEPNIGSYSFDFETETYHPMLVDGVLKSVNFTTSGSSATITYMTPEDGKLTSLRAYNTLRGGINLDKVVVDQNNQEINPDTKFSFTISIHNDKENLFTGEDTPWYAVNGLYYHDSEGNYISEDEAVELYGSKKQADAQGGNVLTAASPFTDASATLTITSSDSLRIANVPAGTTYSIVEADTNGYELISIDKVIALNEQEQTTDTSGIDVDNATVTGEIVANRENNITFTNQKTGYTVNLVKVDANNEDTTLDGVTFDLYSDESHTTKVNTETITTADGGIAELGLLSPGTYYLVETATKPGYNLLTSHAVITVGANGVTYMQSEYSGGIPQNATYENDVYTITVRNSTGVTLPNTGGSGTLPYTLGGIALIMASALVYGFRMRRRERRLN